MSIKRLIGTIIVGLACLMVFSEAQQKDLTIDKQNIIKNMKLKIVTKEKEITAVLYDNETTRDFVSMLPITVNLEDYAKTEMIFYPERKLNTAEAPSGYKPSKGDITYYAPWGDVAIFYKDFSYATGLISIGRIDEEGIEHLKQQNNQKVKIELLQQ